MRIAIILPVYGHSPWLDEALESVITQSSPDWRLLIADDGLDVKGRQWLKAELLKLKDARVKLLERSKNLGLFANLNDAILQAQEDWCLLLCSDDKLNQNALEQLTKLTRDWPEADLILSSFTSIDFDGKIRANDSGMHHDQLRRDTGLVEPEQMLPALLRLGSLNGNLSGMVFKRDLWRKAGPFCEEWRHAADWEWLIRASEIKPILLNRQPIASVRTHPDQLSNKNRNSGHEINEVAQVVKILKDHDLIMKSKKSRKWASHIMQYQLFNQLKKIAHRNITAGEFLESLRQIHESSGIINTCVSMLLFAPRRLKIFAFKKPYIQSK